MFFFPVFLTGLKLYRNCPVVFLYVGHTAFIFTSSNMFFRKNVAKVCFTFGQELSKPILNVEGQLAVKPLFFWKVNPVNATVDGQKIPHPHTSCDGLCKFWSSYFHDFTLHTTKICRIMRVQEMALDRFSLMNTITVKGV